MADREQSSQRVSTTVSPVDAKQLEAEKLSRNDDVSFNPRVPRTARATFIFLSKYGFFNMFACRSILSVTILSMVKSEKRVRQVPYNLNFVSWSFSDPADWNREEPSDGYQHDLGHGTYQWTEFEQGLILSSFFWGYIVPQIPAGAILKRTGDKWGLGCGILFTSTFTLLSPLSSSWSPYALMTVRILQGIAEGLIMPGMHSMIAKWSPPQHRSRFAATIYGGSLLGIIFPQPIAGLLAQSPLGWPSPFYFFGTTGVIWFIFWSFFVFEDPDRHPRISVAEREYIKRSLHGQILTKAEKPKTPWSAILKSMPFWAITVAHFGQNWGFFMFMTQLPTFLKVGLGFSVGVTGFLASLPYVLTYIVSIFMSVFADRLIRHGRMTVTAVRKMATFIGFGTTAFCFTLVAFLGYMRGLAVAIVSIIGAAFGLVYSGFLVNHVDISPNYAGHLFGLTNFAGTIPGCIAPTINGLIINRDPSMSNWRIVFLIATAIYLVSCTFYLIFGSGEVQPWNNLAKKPDTSEEDVEEVSGSPNELYEDHEFTGDGDNRKKESV